MDKPTTPGEQIRELAGYVRLLTALVQPSPRRECLDRLELARALKSLAARLDDVARSAERCSECKLAQQPSSP
ncbi:MAG: hypothetical protein AB7U81_10510 [Thiohalomonadaceae bacterium]